MIWGGEGCRQGRLCGCEPGFAGRQCGRRPAFVGLAGPAAWPQAAWCPVGGCPAGGWSGEDPCSVLTGQAAADEVTQVERGGPVLEPGVVAGGAQVAEFEAPPAAAGDLGDDPFHVRPELLVVLTQAGPGGPVAAGGPQQRVAGVQVQDPAGLVRRAPGAQRTAAAGRAEGHDPAGADALDDTGRAGDGPGVLIGGEVIDGEPAPDRGLDRPGLDHRRMPGLAQRRAQVPVVP